MDMQYKNPYNEQEAEGSVLRGFIGAIIGALIGAVAWAAVAVLLNIITALIGLLIGFLASKGYDLLKGKQSKAKLVCVIIAVIIGVVVGVGGSYVWDIHALYVEEYGHLQGINSAFVRTEAEVFELVLGDGDVQAEIVKNLGLGLLFAFLGCIDLLREMSGKKQTAAPAAAPTAIPSNDVNDAQVPGRRIDNGSNGSAI